MLLCAANPGKVAALSEWLAKPDAQGNRASGRRNEVGLRAELRGAGPLPPGRGRDGRRLESTTRLGQAFTADRSAVFASIQRLRVKASEAGTLKSTPQQDVETKTTSSGQQVIVIEPANPQIVYVPQYNAQTVYTRRVDATVVVSRKSSSDDAVAAGLIGFTAGIAIGAAIDNNYYYGPVRLARRRLHVQRRVGRLVRRPRGRARGLAGPPRGHRRRARRPRENAQEQRTERQQNAQEQRTERQQTRQQTSPESQAQRDARRTEAQTAVRRTQDRGHESGSPRVQRQHGQGGAETAAARSRTPSPAIRAESRSAPPASVGKAAAAARAAEAAPMRVRRSFDDRDRDRIRLRWR